MDEDEIIKGESPGVAYVCNHTGNFLFFFSKNSHLLLTYVIFARFEAIIMITPQRGASSACLVNKVWH